MFFVLFLWGERLGVLAAVGREGLEEFLESECSEFVCWGERSCQFLKAKVYIHIDIYMYLYSFFVLFLWGERLSVLATIGKEG